VLIWDIRMKAKKTIAIATAAIATVAIALLLVPKNCFASSGTCTACKLHQDGNSYMKCQGSMYGGTVYKKCGSQYR
jgi:hypothetical protein